MYEKQIDFIRSSPTNFLQNVSMNMQPTIIMITRATVIVAVTVFLSTVLCFKKKKRCNNGQKTEPNVEKKEIGKDALKCRLHGKENQPSSNPGKDDIFHVPAEPYDSNRIRMPREMDNKSASRFGSMEPINNDGENVDQDEKEGLYPHVPEPTPSAKRKREEALEKDKEEKIKEGFYQSRSDEDDTLGAIKSLKDEETEPEDKSVSKQRRKKKKNGSKRESKKRKPKSKKSHKSEQKTNVGSKKKD